MCVRTNHYSGGDEMPPLAPLEPSANRPAEAAEGSNALRAAFTGWKKQRERSRGTAAEYERAVELFIQFHGNLSVAMITRDHARKFREALQDVPRFRSKQSAEMALPQLVEWRRTHPEAQRSQAGP
jgi:hypothetical protein